MAPRASVISCKKKKKNLLRQKKPDRSPRSSVLSPASPLYSLTCATSLQHCSASYSWLCSEVVKDSQKLQPRGNGCYRNRTYVRCPFSHATSPNTSSRRDLLLPAPMVKIERYQRIHISSRTAACYCRLHLVRSLGGRLGFRYL